ncbi:hypothetical protein GmHk_17G049570 [Glycine max]|nr:hypothetical protein GmHk_17G049570 [Glycine max]
MMYGAFQELSIKKGIPSRSVPKASHSVLSCVIACSRTPTLSGSARPHASTPQTKGYRRNAPTTPRAPRRHCFPLASPSSSSSCPLYRRHSLMVAVDASPLLGVGKWARDHGLSHGARRPRE